jgi:hypothetical protein
LFVADADRLTDQQIDVFDDILGHRSRESNPGRSPSSAAALRQFIMPPSRWCADLPATTTSSSPNRF